MTPTPATLYSLANETGWQLRLYVRDRVALFFTFAFPPFILFWWSRQPGQDVVSATALIAALALVMGGYAGLAQSIAAARQAGVLKRVRSLPVAMALHIAARVVAAGLLGALALGLTLGLGALWLHVPLSPTGLLSLLTAFVLGFAALGSWGLVVGSLARTAGAASYLTSGTVFPMFLLPVAAQRGMLPEWAAALTPLLPPQSLALLIQAALEGEGAFLLPPILILLVWAALGLALAARRLSRPL